jgi:thiamine biosynthesis protein ThiI
MPVLRPLVGMDKDEITAEAERLGTFPISIVPDEDCCTLFTPRHPETRGRPADVEAAERALAIDELVQTAASQAAVEHFEFPAVKYQAAPADGVPTRRTS